MSKILTKYAINLFKNDIAERHKDKLYLYPTKNKHIWVCVNKANNKSVEVGRRAVAIILNYYKRHDLSIQDKIAYDFSKKEYRFIYDLGGRGGAKTYDDSFASLFCSITHGGSRQYVLRLNEDNIVEDLYPVFKFWVNGLGLEGLRRDYEQAILKFKNGSIIYFRSVQAYQSHKAKGLFAPNMVWVEEAGYFKLKTLNTLAPSVREKGSFIIFSYNFETPNDDIEIFRKNNSDGALVRYVNYHNNPFIRKSELWHEIKRAKKRIARLKKSKDVVERTEAERLQEDFNFIYLGRGLQYSSALVYYNKFEILGLDKKVKDVDVDELRVGVDWGNSDTGITAFVLVGRKGGDLYILSELKVTKELFGDVSPDYLIRLYDLWRNDATIFTVRQPILAVADGANGFLLGHFQSQGYQMVAATGDVKAILQGIANINSFNRIYINKDCKYFIEEIENYKYNIEGDMVLKTKNPIDKNNHFMDAFRYAINYYDKSLTRGSVAFYKSWGGSV